MSVYQNEQIFRIVAQWVRVMVFEFFSQKSKFAKIFGVYIGNKV